MWAVQAVESDGCLPGELNQSGEGGGVQRQDRAVRVLAVTNGDQAARGDEVGGDLYALAAVAAVRRLEPSGGFGRHWKPFRSSSIMAVDAAWESASACN